MSSPLAIALLLLAPPWDEVSPGLEVSRVAAPRAPHIRLTLVRVDPARYRFSLLSAKLKRLTRAPTAAEWVSRSGVSGVVNAGMYQADRVTSVGYMRDGQQVNQGAWSRDQAVFVSEPRGSSLPPVQILDRSCQPTGRVASAYRVAVQSIRMLDCRRRNVWRPQPPQWGTVSLGIDGRGRVLLVHVRALYGVHDLVEDLRALPLDLVRLMYLEGGREATLHVVVGGRTVVSEMGGGVAAGLLVGPAALPNAIAFAPR